MKSVSVICAIGIAFCVFGAVMSVRQSLDFARRCERAGGEPYQGRGVRLCVKPGHLIHLQGEKR